MKRSKITYSAAELAWISENRELTRRELRARFVAKFDRDDITVDNLKSLCTRNGWLTGRTGQIEKGNVPHNKGKKMPYHPRVAATQFKKGHRGGIAAKVYKPVGTERISKDGYLERKVNDDMPLQRRWRAVHLINWEAVNGPLPKGHALKCLDGNKLNTAAENWELISRSMLPRLAGAKKGINYDTAPAELRPALMATAKIEQAIREART